MVEPSTHVSVVRVQLQAAMRAENAVAGLSQRENSNLREAMLEAWQRWHAVIMEEDAPPLSSYPQASHQANAATLAVACAALRGAA